METRLRHQMKTPAPPAYPEPEVLGNRHSQRGLPLYALRQIWTIDDTEPTGPYWELVFR